MINNKNYIIYWLRKNQALITLLLFILLSIVGALVFYYRYPFNFTESNFYAEDGSIFLKNILEQGNIQAMTTLFNGYLIVGVYIVGSFGRVLNDFIGGSFQTLAQSVAVASYLFWGLICALPYLFFRKKLGLMLSLVVVLLLWLTPMGGYNYAVFGTIGNLKYAFFYIAFMLVMYRNDSTLANRIWKIIIVDIGLLVCLMTNLIVAALIPLILIRYRSDILNLIKSHRLRPTSDLLSAVIMASVGTCYVTIILFHGIPAMPGYLDGPLDKSTLPAILYRGSFYGLMQPLTTSLNNYTLMLIFFILAIIAFKSKYRLQLAILAYALILNVAGFVYNRPGVTAFFVSYDDMRWPGNIFYAGTMIFVFGIIYIYRQEINSYIKKSSKVLLVMGLLLFVSLLLPFSVSSIDNNRSIAKRNSLAAELATKCQSSSGSDDITVDIYPSSGWTMTVSRNIACK